MHPISYAFLGATWAACMAAFLGTPTYLTIGLLTSCMLAALALGI